MKIKSKEELKEIIEKSNQHWIIKIQLLMFFEIIEEYEMNQEINSCMGV
jgi:hypothetical protein